jgi:ribosomal protein S18 acetylase RimI-like enzyme
MTEGRVVIRKASVEDAFGIAKVHVDTWHSTYTGIIREDHLAQLSYERAEEVWRGRMSTPHPKGSIYVAEDPSGNVVGFVTGGGERTSDYPFDGEIYAIYVLKDHQRQGIGRLLISTMCQQLIEDGYHSLLIWVLEKNPSRAFYDKLGGEIIADQDIEIGGESLPEIGYGWKNLHQLSVMTE